MATTLRASRQAGWKVIAMLVICIAAGVYLVPRMVPEDLQKRVAEGTSGSSFRDRLDLMKSGLTAWTKRPLQGFGLGAYERSSASVGGRLGVAHNTFVSILVEDGLIGMGIYLTFWAMLIRTILSFPKMEKRFWLTVLVGYAPSLMSASAEYEKPLWFLCAMILAQSITVAKDKALPKGRPTPPRRFGANTT
jgi:O-antigen ligase